MACMGLHISRDLKISHWQFIRDEYTRRWRNLLQGHHLQRIRNVGRVGARFLLVEREVVEYFHPAEWLEVARERVRRRREDLARDCPKALE